MSRMEQPCARKQVIVAASTKTRGLPSRFPFALAFLKPAQTRSTISERSNSATADSAVFDGLFEVGQLWETVGGSVGGGVFV
jgi:hypothetical protein